MDLESRIKSIETATDKNWDDWLSFMDSVDAKDLSHHQIATKVLEQLADEIENPGWYAQSVTVAYEQHIGRRIPGQQPDGLFRTSVSRSTKHSMEKLMAMWTDFAKQDEEVLKMIDQDPRISGTEKRITWRTKGKDGSSLNIISEPKKDGTASLVVQHMDLETPEMKTEAKENWVKIVTRFLENSS